MRFRVWFEMLAPVIKIGASAAKPYLDNWNISLVAPLSISIHWIRNRNSKEIAAHFVLCNFQMFAQRSVCIGAKAKKNGGRLIPNQKRIEMVIYHMSTCQKRDYRRENLEKIEMLWVPWSRSKIKLHFGHSLCAHSNRSKSVVHALRIYCYNFWNRPAAAAFLVACYFSACCFSVGSRTRSRAFQITNYYREKVHVT